MQSHAHAAYNLVAEGSIAPKRVHTLFITKCAEFVRVHGCA